ncbi:MAG: phosphoesterase [Planctomycetota bacterium]|nr:phosphoesterase [Planctomycetota bacterium]
MPNLFSARMSTPVRCQTAAIVLLATFAAGQVAVEPTPAGQQPPAREVGLPVTPQTPAGPFEGVANAFRVSTAQLIRPAGAVLELPGSRPVDMITSPDGRFILIKDNQAVRTFSAAAWSPLSSAKFPKDGGSMTGLACTHDGSAVWATNSASELMQFLMSADGTLSVGRRIVLPTPPVGDAAFGCGLALTRDDAAAYVCLSRANMLARVDLKTGTVGERIDVGIAPYAVVLNADQTLAYVTNWGGRKPRKGDRTATSAGSEAVVDERGVSSSGTVCAIDLSTSKVLGELEVGLSPSSLVLTRDGSTLFVACGNSDTIAEIDTVSWRIRRDLSTRPDAQLPVGSLPSSLALAPDEQTLYVCNAGNNAVAVIDLRPDATRLIKGFIPTGWFPGALLLHDQSIYIANIRGNGSRQARGDGATNSRRHMGTLQKVAIPDSAQLETMTRQALADARVPQALASLARAEHASERTPLPVPAAAGDPSVFEHVIYIIKENRTYDQIFGDLAQGPTPKGKGEPSLCIYGREVTPNQHALAEQFVLLDNYYCNGVLSADGHSWATEGTTTAYLERSFGGFSRSYTFGNDPLTYASSGFVWDRVLAAGWSFRNYGEFDETSELPDSQFPQIWEDWKQGLAGGERHITFKSGNIGVERVRQLSCLDYPGWNLDIPDQIRADVFLKEFDAYEKSGELPNFITIYLPNDHTSGTSEGNPTPRALVADNDLAVGRIVEAVSKSRYWPKTVLFINEDDPQDGWDHIDGHRSTCLVISPYTKRGAVVSDFYSQSSVIHTIERIFGVAPTNQRYALSDVMSNCFAATVDLAPFQALPANISLTEMNPRKQSLAPRALHFALLSERQNFDRIDAANEDDLNRILWHAARGEEPYPAQFAGAHGKGLKGLGLAPDPASSEDDETGGDDD